MAQACHLRKVSAEEGVIESPVDVKEGLGEVIPHTVAAPLACESRWRVSNRNDEMMMRHAHDDRSGACRDCHGGLNPEWK